MPTILLAHTDTDDRDMYADYLRFQGYEVVVVSSTDEATTFVADCDLLVTGLMVSGHCEPIELITGAVSGAWGRKVPVVVLTTCAVVERREQARAAGAEAVLLKPCYPQHILSEVERVLAQRTVRM